MRRTTEQHDPIAQLYRGLDTEDTGSAVSVILKLRGERPTEQAGCSCPVPQAAADAVEGSSGGAPSRSNCTAGNR
ncbi:hypothetical protein [Streptomyces sp. 6-11-2]|uniref:hypothetical protein n=1 Tax=Streptomyces sp. 6-11-2 TaxID=2585753 RepID=UPI001141BE63|nr:hypothetical protein [Streptomyces sp. 6-11-2]GED88616.1 hypothetical protein TNCT6_57010 [Streptomyces sp. 6-11-2]